jgi:histone H3/H4
MSQRDFCDSLVKISLSQLLNHLGVDRIHSLALDFLVEVFNEYLMEMGLLSRGYCENGGRGRVVYQDLLFMDFCDLKRW